MIYFIFGLFWGSLINNIAYRLARNQNFIFSRSKCDYCHHQLSFVELIPLLSYLWQLGRCKNCQKKISFRYPLSELITGLFVYKIAEKTLLFNSFNFLNLIFFLYFLLITSVIFILSLYDLETFYIDERLIYFSILVWLIFILIFTYFNFPSVKFSGDFSYFIYLSQKNIKEYFFNKLYFSYFLALSVLTLFILTLGKGIGLGDAKILFILGLYFEIGDIIISLLMTIFIGGFFSLLFFIKGFKLKQEIPFGPFIFLGLFLNIMLGDLIYKLLFEVLISL